jgi:glucosamine--fructose-6-phosphate aminotransferase (isomerizing)
LKSEHVLLHEAREQPAAIRDTLNTERRQVSRTVKFLRRKNLHFLGMGSSYFASLYAKYLLQELAQRRAEIHLASEFIHYPPTVESNDVFVAISQSGESIETVKAVELLKRKRALILGITNDPASRLARLSTQLLLTHAGKERVSATKTFTSTLALVYELATALAVRTRKISRRRRDLLSNHLMQIILTLEERFEEWEEASRLWADRLASCRSTIVIGRGPNLVAALQGALLLKEVAKLPAEGMSGGEFTHGPIEAISDEIGVVVLGGGRTAGLQIKLAHRAKSLGSRVLMLAPRKVEKIDSISFGQTDEALMVFPCIFLLNLLTYYSAIKKGLNPDKFNVISKVTRRE